MKYKTYPKMKDSGIEWIGDIPEEWLTPSVSKIYDIQLGKMLQPKPESDEDVLMPYLKAENVHWEHVKTKDLPKMWAKPFEIVKYGVKKGDLLVCEGGEGGRSAILSTNMDGVIIQNALHRIRGVKNANLQYLMYNLITCNIANWFDVINNKATIAHFTKEKFSLLKLLHPSKEEQKQIAEFLDSQTSKIDSEIQKNKKLVTLLQEKRQATINHAVTKGLDDSVPMKDSGVEWIGDIPEEWNIRRLKFTTSFDNSTVDRHTYDDEIRVRICHYPQVYKNEVITSKTDLELGTCTKKELDKFQLKKDDILITKDSETPNEIGIPVYIQENFRNVVSGYHIAHLTTNKNKILGSFLFRYLQSNIANGYFETEANGVTRFGLGKDSISNLKLFLPSISEQKQIAKFLDSQTTKIDKLISRTKLQITTLQEYRQSLISSAVTGKIDVREAIA